LRSFLLWVTVVSIALGVGGALAMFKHDSSIQVAMKPACAQWKMIPSMSVRLAEPDAKGIATRPYQTYTDGVYTVLEDYGTGTWYCSDDKGLIIGKVIPSRTDSTWLIDGFDKSVKPLEFIDAESAKRYLELELKKRGN
jgi:hypothetical protein